MSQLPTSRIGAGIDRLEGRAWDRLQPVYAPEQVLPETMGLIQIDAAGIDHEESGPALTRRLQSAQQRLMAGLYSSMTPWALLAVGDGNQTGIYLALSAANPLASWGSLLYAALPGAELRPGPQPAEIWSALADFPNMAAVTGNPSIASAAKGSTTDADNRPADLLASTPPGLESLLRVMRGTRWAYLACASPVSPTALHRAIEDLTSEQREIISSYQRRNSAEEQNHPFAAHYVSLLRAALHHHEIGRQQGMWQAHLYLLAESSIDLSRGAQTLQGTYAGPHSQPQPIRVRSCHTPASGRTGVGLPSTWLNTPELAAMAHPPGEEQPGYRLRRRTRFAVALPDRTQTSRQLSLGQVLDETQPTDQWLDIEPALLTRHILIAGASGSGKTRTCQFILRQLWEEHGVPWLVIEPSLKSEYRALLDAPCGESLQVFTLGDATTSPLSFNPLEVQDGVAVQSHIDALLTLFKASLSLSPPMPEVLSQALHRLYEQCGWDLAGGPAESGVERRQPSWPELTETVRVLIDELGYDPEITGNLRAALGLRLATLASGGRRHIFHSSISVSMETLLSRPTVIEMASIGDDDAKAFLLGALLLRLAEYRQVTGDSGGDLRHLTLIEEAHRLLRAPSSNRASDHADPAGRAVETFCHLLAEARAYGEGFAIVDQLPTKLAPEAVKNTGLKIVHRLVAEDDRRLVGQTMNLDEPRQRHLATLPTGQAVAYSENREEAYLLRVPNHAGAFPASTTMPSQRRIAEHMQRLIPRAEHIAAERTPQRAACHDEPADNSHMVPIIPDCPACGDVPCAHREQIIMYLLTTDEMFDVPAVDNHPDWHAIWQYGQTLASQIWPQPMPPAATLCVLMMLAQAGGMSPAGLEQMRRHLRGFATR